MKFKVDFWLKFSLVNLFLVALLGSLLRYKIGFPFPALEFKNLLHSHSHFAFAGWITHTIMVLMIYFLQQNSNAVKLTKYSWYLMANLFTAYGMMVAFILQSYAFWSILFSTLSIFISYGFSYAYYKDLKTIQNKPIVKKWFSGALFFLVISSIGTFGLAYMTATKNIVQSYQLGSIYFYLHFQYNGWFFFACMALLLNSLKLGAGQIKLFSKVYLWFFTSCLVGYFLSILWVDLPWWVIVIAILFAVIQFVVWIIMLVSLLRHNKSQFQDKALFLKNILRFVVLCATLKFVLQILSTLPSLSSLAFGFRTLAIGYLHLVLLAVISLYLLYYIYANRLMSINTLIKWGLISFAIGVFLNELALAIQGLTAFGIFLLPKINQTLFGIALLLCVSIALVAFSPKSLRIKQEELK
ncbi:MAG TPA: hypothetical protein VLZ11_01250 [Flavobacterium sp.]|nr:hypothetical protein [Flavobacterium sp.]